MKNLKRDNREANFLLSIHIIPVKKIGTMIEHVGRPLFPGFYLFDLESKSWIYDQKSTTR